jgi:hypothetical protein
MGFDTARIFLLGLFTGLMETHFTNVRMGLAAHLEGVLNGIFVVALGATWTGVRLPNQAKAMAFWTAIYGTYANWLTTTLAAAKKSVTSGPGTGNLVTGAATAASEGDPMVGRISKPGSLNQYNFQSIERQRPRQDVLANHLKPSSDRRLPDRPGRSPSVACRRTHHSRKYNHRRC